MEQGPLGIHITTALSFADAEREVRAALATEGFGVLTFVDVTATLREKIGATIEPFTILGACNPKLAHQALEVWRGFGLLMPCNVVVQDVGTHRVVQAFDPLTLPQARDVPEIESIARQLTESMRRVLARVEAIPAP
jgi:uncharacterized protein (DUF302 family)